MAMKARAFEIEGSEIQLPSHVELVEGLNERIAEKIDAYDSTTVTTRLAALDDVYLGLHAQADRSSVAGSCTTAYRATFDGVENDPNYPIHAKYYKKTDTVDKAMADDLGNHFREKYCKIDGSYSGLTAGNATVATSAGKAKNDAGGNDIQGTYIKAISNATGGTTITYTKGDNTTGTFTTKDTTYPMDSVDQNGIMYASDKRKLDALSTDTSRNKVGYADVAGKWASSTTIAVAGGGSGSATLDGSNRTAVITLGSLNADSITSGKLAVARGGTGSDNLSLVTVGAANKLSTARTINMTGGVTGSVAFDGSANVTMASTQLNVSNVNGGVLSTLNGGTGRTDGYAQGLAKDTYINGFKYDGASSVKFTAFCETGANTQIKQLFVNGLWSNYDRSIITVLFRYPNRADNPLLRVWALTAYVEFPIYRNGERVCSANNNLAFTTNAYQAVSFLLQYISDDDVRADIIEAPVAKLESAPQLAISGGVKANNVVFNGSQNVTLNAATLDFNGFTSISNSLPVANGGTGQVDGTVAKLHTARSINGIPFDGSSGVQFFGECTTAAGTRLKTVSIPNFTLDSVVTHPIIAVKFNEINTINSPSLNVNGTGDFAIMYPTSQSLANVQGAFTSQPNQVVFMYLSTYFSSISSQTYNVWVIITDPVPYKVVLRGAVIGTSDLPDPAFYPQYTINTEFDQSYAYQGLRSRNKYRRP